MKEVNKKKTLQEMEEIRHIGEYSPFQGPSSHGENALTGSSGARVVRGPMDLFVSSTGTRTNDGPSGTPEGPGNTRQVTLNASWQKELRSKVCMSIGGFFIENGLPFNVATSPAYWKMLEDVSSFGRGFKGPTMHELRTWILSNYVTAMDLMLDDSKASWAEIGCSILSDGWTDIKGRTLINFLVNNPKGTWFLKSVDASDEVKNADYLFTLLDQIVEEVGEKNVIQVITNNASAYKKAGEKLMEKRQTLYWTPCAAHCIDLMLEDIMKLSLHDSVFKKAKQIINYIYAHAWVVAMVRKSIGGDLVRPAVTRFATAFLTLQRLLAAKDALEAFFTSKK